MFIGEVPKLKSGSPVAETNSTHAKDVPLQKKFHLLSLQKSSSEKQTWDSVWSLPSTE